MLLSDRCGLLRVPSFAAAVLAMFLAVTAQAMAASYITLFAVERVGMSPLELGVFLTLSGISGIGATSLLARILDNRPRLWPLALSLALGAMGYGLCTVTADRWTLMIVAFFLLGPATASFPLIYAMAKSGLDQRGASLAAQGMAALRMIASLSWVVGPAMGALLIHHWSYAGVYGAAAGCCICALLTVRGFMPASLSSVAATTPARPVTLRRTVQAAALALTVFNIAMFMGSTALSIVVVNDLGGSERDVGLMFSLCAAAEVVVMSIFIFLPAKWANRSLLIAGFAVFSLYFLSVALLPMLQVLYGAQVLRAIGIGIISVVGMLLLQELSPGRAGAASALFANTTNAGWLLAGVVTGPWAEMFGYRSIFGLCAALSWVGGALLIWESSFAAETRSP